MKKILFILIVFSIFWKGVLAMNFKISSQAFQEGESIPKQYTCEGADRSPPVQWTDPPAETKSFALIMDDPDAPMGTWVHWVLYNLPVTTRTLSEGFPTSETLPNGAKQATTSFGRTGYGGPCPPPGRAHRYFFKLYALDQMLSLSSQATKKELELAMKGHILAEAQLMGKYQR